MYNKIGFYLLFLLLYRFIFATHSTDKKIIFTIVKIIKKMNAYFHANKQKTKPNKYIKQLIHWIFSTFVGFGNCSSVVLIRMLAGLFLSIWNYYCNLYLSNWILWVWTRFAFLGFSPLTKENTSNKLEIRMLQKIWQENTLR